MDLSGARIARYTRRGLPLGAAARRAARPTAGVRVFYGHDRVPAPGERAAGGTAKAQKLNERFPNSPTDFSLLYLGSTWLPRDLRPLLRLRAASPDSRRREPGRRRLSGVGGRSHRGGQPTAPPRAPRRPTTSSTRASSRSGRPISSSASREGRGRSFRTPWTSNHFTPAERPPAGGPVLLLGGDQTQAYRLELALRTLAALLPRHPDARLLVTGRLVSSGRAARRRAGATRPGRARR